MNIRRALSFLITTTLIIGVVSTPRGASADPAPKIPGGGGTPSAGKPPATVKLPRTAQPAAAPAAAPAGYPVRGIDVSSYQGNVNWASVAAAGTKFAYVKATEGTTYFNPYFNQQYHGAKNYGMFAGAYAFARPDAPNAAAQANYFVAHAQFANDGRTLPLMLDLEWPYSGSGVTDSCWGLSPAAMVAWIKAFVGTVRALTGKPMLIYTNPYWWNPCTGNSTAFSDQYLNISYWNSSPPTYLPSGWSQWTVWQYADSGPQPGDQDVFNGSLSGLANFASPDAPGRTSPSTVVAGGSVQVFYQGGDGRLWYKWHSASGWNGPTALNAGVLGGPPTAVGQADGSVDIFWRGGDGHLWHLHGKNGTWSTTASLGAGIRSDPSASVTPQGTLDVVYSGTDSRLWDVTYSSGSWHAPVRLNAGQVSSRPQVVAATDGTADIFWRGQDNGLWQLTRTGAATWTAAQRRGAGLRSDPAPVRSASWTTDVFFQGPDGRLWHSWRNGTRWYGPQLIGGGVLGGGPQATGQTSGVIDVFWRGGDGQLWHEWYVGGGWHGPQAFGGHVAAGPSAVAQANGVIDVFFNDNLRMLSHEWYIGGRWYGPENQGGFVA